MPIPMEARYRDILKYALPLVLSNSGGTILQFTDRMFLAWHAPESVAGAGVAGMICICFIGMFGGVTGFTNVFAAQYLGSGRPERLGPAVWQGLYLSVIFGAACFALSFAAKAFFPALGHGDAVTAAEITYFTAYMRGGFVFLATSAILGYFIGRGETGIVMAVQLVGIALNVVLDYAMIFGKWGFPAWGVSGAVWATVASQAVMLALGLGLFWSRARRRENATWTGRSYEPALTRRLIRYGLPNGLRVIIELVMWSVFLALIGLIGDDELAVSNVAFSINNLAWQPMIGIGMAVSMLVGRAQGAERPDVSRTLMRRGFALTQCWMVAAALSFVAVPGLYLGLFFDDVPPDQLARLVDMGTVLLMFVAAYCLLDGLNVVYGLGLTGAGDSWFIFKVTLFLSATGTLAMLLIYRYDLGLYAYWTVGTLYVGVSGLIWYFRYRGKAWEGMKVVETRVVE